MKAKAKPKARAGGVRRPAGARAPARRGGGAVPRRMRLRRPAADPSGVAGRGGPTPWMKGEQVLLREVDPRDLVSGQVIVIQGLYFGNIVKLAAVVQKAEVEKGETYLQVKAQGTTSEELLKVHSGDPRAPFQIHCCPEHCSLHESGDRLVHGRTGYLLLEDAAREDWVNNLEAAIPVVEEKEDELRELRRRERDLEGMGLPVEDGKKKDHRKASSSRSSGNKRKKKKKRKEKKREKSKRRERSEGKEKDKRKRRDASHDGRSPVASSQKDLHPRERIRLRVVRRARRFAARKKEVDFVSVQRTHKLHLHQLCAWDFHKQQFFVRVQQQGDREGGQPSRGVVQGDQPGSSNPRTLPRGAVCRVSAEHVGEPTYSPRRRNQRRGAEASGPVVLQAGAPEQGQCSPIEGDPQSGNRHRLSGKRKTCTGRRRLDSEVEGARDGSSWSSLVCVPENGGSSSGVFDYSSPSRTTPCSKRDTPRQQDQVPHRDGSQPECGERERQDKEGVQGPGRKRERRSRRQEGWQGQRKRAGCQVRRTEVGEDDHSCGAGVEGQIYDDGAALSRSEPGKCRSMEKEEKFAGLGRELPLRVFQGADQGPLTPSSQQYSSLPELNEVAHGLSGTSQLSEEKDASNFSLEGLRMKGLGHGILQRFLEVLPFRSKPTGGRDVFSVFPLPTSRDVLKVTFPDFGMDDLTWLLLVSLGLNSIWGGDIFNDSSPTRIQTSCLRELARDVERLCSYESVLERFQWEEFFKHRSIDYQGEEVRVARAFKWENISPALPVEVGRVPLEGVCTLGCKFYVENFDLYVKPRDEWPPISKPRVMVKDEDWGDVCRGLVGSGVCCLLPRDDVFEGPDGPLVNGMFGVTKDEMSDGVEVFRLIMNLIPLNSICYGIEGDVGTLPSWSMMNPLMLQPSEALVVSSEDVRCFFYVMRVPVCWHKYLAFNKVVPDSALPPDLVGQEVYLASRVLPMGFVNSVSLAQHVHRNLALAGDDDNANAPEAELRKDKSFTVADPSWRVYLDNFDVFEKFDKDSLGGMVGSLAPSILSLRSQYEYWQVPRNVKKAVTRQTRAEVQGAVVDGDLGVAYPRECKLLRYVAASLAVCDAFDVTQRQVQVVCGGLVYVSMFRRPLLGCLNAVWSFVESFDHNGAHRQQLPSECRLEILRFLSLLPLARMDFRLKVDDQVTCSDASTTGGGICASVGLTPSGVLASSGRLRGECPEVQHELRVLTIGLFDGIAALRVAMDLLEVDVLGHIGVEVNDAAARVTEANFPGVRCVNTVEEVTEEMVREWSCSYSQAALVLVGAGPPCQGVSGLNAERKGALRDARSSLFFHVSRITTLVKVYFPWAQVQSLMESVASMDKEDQDVMSADFGSDPWKIDAGLMLWCNRPRLYWLTWGLTAQPGAELFSEEHSQVVKLVASQPLEDVTKEGWVKIDESSSFPTFTTSRPRERAGYKPAGVHQCSLEELKRWEADSYRFPPYWDEPWVC